MDPYQNLILTCERQQCAVRSAGNPTEEEEEEIGEKKKNYQMLK